MRTRSKVLRLTYLGLIFLALISPFGTAFAQQEGPQVDVLTVKGAVTPIVAGYIERGIEQAQKDGAVLLVIQLDTPGGSVEIMEGIVQSMSASRLPIAVYVAPRGAKAASAGTFLVLAAHVAAMAPSTSIGAASPIAGQGEELPETAREKAENVLVALIKGLSDRRGERAVEWAEKAVREAAAATEKEALELGIIDAIADDLDELLVLLDGKTVDVRGQTMTLSTRNAVIKDLPMNLAESFLHTITDPNIAFILLILGLNGILFELANPGAILPGVVGGIALLLGFFALGVLPVNYTGLLLILLAFVMFVADIKTASHGILTAGGLVSLVLGSLILFNTPLFAISRSLIFSVALVTAAFFAFAVQAAVRARRRKPTTGREGLVGAVGVARSDLEPEGTVSVWGEIWQAQAIDGAIRTGERVEVVGVDGFRLRVRKIN